MKDDGVGHVMTYLRSPVTQAPSHVSGVIVVLSSSQLLLMAKSGSETGFRNETLPSDFRRE